MRFTTSQALALLAALGIAVDGCSSVGPKTIDRDRFDYVMAISESWKRQMLVNLVKVRYDDIPVFMDVSSVINSYTLEGEVELGFSWSSSNTQSLGGTGTYIDKPTITYSPLVGEKFTRSLLKPIPVSAVMLLLQGGVPAEMVLRICTASVNGVRNGASGAVSARKADPQFDELLMQIRRAQEINAIDFRAQVSEGTDKVTMVLREPSDPAEAAVIADLRGIMGLDPDLDQYPVVYGSFPTNGSEVAIQTRAVMQIAVEYASFIDVPERDLAEGRAYVCAGAGPGGETTLPPILAIHSGSSPPDDAYVAAEYGGHSFWIEDRDILSKSAFSFLLILFSFTERGSDSQRAPVVTVPAS